MRNSVVFAALYLLVSLAGCSEPPAVRTVQVTKSLVEATVPGVTSGTVEAVRITDLAFGTVGRVKVVNAKRGDSVVEGAVIAELENADLETAARNAQSELDRMIKLVEREQVSRSQFDQALSVRDAAKLNLEKSRIRAPFTGTIVQMNLEVGQLSQITAVIPLPLVKLVDNAPRYVRVEIDEVDLPRVTVGLPARVKILAVRREPFSGRVRKVIPYVSNVREQDRTALVEIDIESEGILLPAGASADAEVIVESRAEVAAVPFRAVLGRASDRFVLKLDGETVRRVPVQLGIFNFGLAEVKKGLEIGDVVILPLDGVDLADGAKVRVESKQ